MPLWLEGAGDIEFENILLGANIEWSVSNAPSDVWGPLKRSLLHLCSAGASASSTAPRPFLSGSCHVHGAQSSGLISLAGSDAADQPLLLKTCSPPLVFQTLYSSHSLWWSSDIFLISTHSRPWGLALRPLLFLHPISWGSCLVSWLKILSVHLWIPSLCL